MEVESDFSQSENKSIRLKENLTIEELLEADTVTKYRLSADIANAALNYVGSLILPGRKIHEICRLGDQFITTETAKHYVHSKDKKTGKPIERGIAVPTTISCNDIINNYSPLTGDVAEIQPGALVKIHLGVHIDGYPAIVAHSFVCAPPNTMITGRHADVLAAAAIAAEAVKRTLNYDIESKEISKVINSVANQFEVKPLLHTYSYRLSRWNLVDDELWISNNPDLDDAVETKAKPFKFQPGYAFVFDIIMTTGETATKSESDAKTTIYRRLPDKNYQLRIKSSRDFLYKVQLQLHSFPFSVRELDDAPSRVGINDCVKHELLEKHPVERSKNGLVARQTFTVLFLPKGPLRVTGVPVDVALQNLSSHHSLEDAGLLKLLGGSHSSLRSSKPPASSSQPAVSQWESNDVEMR